jgi:hypothetical protein
VYPWWEEEIKVEAFHQQGNVQDSGVSGCLGDLLANLATAGRKGGGLTVPFFVFHITKVVSSDPEIKYFLF